MTNRPTMKLRTYTLKNLETLPQLQTLPAQQRHAMWVVAHVLPFRCNNYVIDELIDWTNIPEDPVFQLTFPQPGMLSDEHFALMSDTLTHGSSQEIRQVADSIRRELNPHPAGQIQHNVPTMDD